MLIFISIGSHLVPSLLHLHHHLTTCLNDTFSLSPSQLPKSLSAEAFRRRKWKRREIKIIYQYLQSSCLFISDEKKVGDRSALYLVDCWFQWADLRLKSLFFVCSQTFFFAFVSERCLRSRRTFRDSKDRLSEVEEKETCLAGTFSTNISVPILLLRDLLLCFGNWRLRKEKTRIWVEPGAAGFQNCLTDFPSALLMSLEGAFGREHQLPPGDSADPIPSRSQT